MPKEKTETKNSEEKNLADKIIWITGASRGIGAAIAWECHKAGATLAMSSRATADTERMNKTILEENKKSLALACDVRDAESVDCAYQGIVQEFGRVDILINNAGTGHWKNLWELSVHDFDQTIETNLRGNFLTMRSVLPEMIARKSGVILNILSVAAIRAYPYGAAYNTSKAGALMLSKVAREEVREHGIKIIDILPGATETEIWDKEAREQYSGRMMQPQDIADAVVKTLLLNPRIMPEEIILRPQLGDI